MRPSKIGSCRKLKWLCICALALVALVQLLKGVTFSNMFFSDRNFGFDLRLRRNEVRCAHHGVSSFRVWNREATCRGFAPIDRPDKEKVVAQAGDVLVHAYPPWHTALFWFYGWLPERLCLALMSLVFGLCACFVMMECGRVAKMRFEDPRLVSGLALCLILCPVAQCFFPLNYGMLILAAFFLMNRSVERHHDIVAGLAWAVMMIKPQVGLLFAWPMLWHRRWLAIAVAVTACVLLTCFTSFAVGESVLDMILQVPEIGKPYGANNIVVDRLLQSVLSVDLRNVIMIAFFVLTGVLTFLLRKKNDFLITCAPVSFIIPIWTYCQPHDRMIMLIWYLLLAGRIFDSPRFDKWTAFGSFLCCAEIMLGAWGSFINMGALRQTLSCYYALRLVSYALMMFFFVLFTMEEIRKCYPNFFLWHIWSPVARRS